MATFQNFRSAFNGFNREDVVHYIEYTNNKHAAQINQLKTDLQALQAELAEKSAVTDLTAELEAAVAAKAEAEAEAEALRAELATLREPRIVPKAKPAAPVYDELEAYRRAERAERKAEERVAHLYQKANGVLAEAAIRTDEASVQIDEIVERINAQLTELKAALSQGKATMKSVTSTLQTISPLSDNE